MAAIVTPDDSILRTIAKMVDADGLEGGDQYYDQDLTIHINTALFELYQVGVGNKGFTVTGEDETWSDYLGDDLPHLQAAKDFIYASTKLIFDPPQSTAMQAALKETADRILYRLREQVECTQTL